MYIPRNAVCHCHKENFHPVIDSPGIRSGRERPAAALCDDAAAGGCTAETTKGETVHCKMLLTAAGASFPTVRLYT